MNPIKYICVINPKAGKGKDENYGDYIKALFKTHSIECEIEYTNHQGHAFEITQEKIQNGSRNFVIIGGDGTLNEVVNGMFSQSETPTNELYLGMIPQGTGNDWARYYNIPRDVEQAISLIASRNTILQDVGKIDYQKIGKSHQSFFINIAGFGFDAAIVVATNKMLDRGHRKKIAYLFNLIKCLFSYKDIPMEIEINNEKFSIPVFSINVGNGKYSGGGMIQTPDAKIDDGILDVTLYSNLSKWTVITNLPKLYNGKILNAKGITGFKTTSLKVSSNTPIYGEVDGETIGDNQYIINVLPKSLNVIVEKN